MFSSVLSRIPGKKIIFWAKIAVLAGLLIYIGYVLRQQPFDWNTLRTRLRTVDHPELWCVSLLVLTPINWGLEALKWWLLLQRIEKTSFWGAYRGVLAGVSLGFALPAQLGDTAGRVLSLREGKRGPAIGASLVSGGMQFYVALVLGMVAWGYHLRLVPDRNNAAGRWLLAALGILSLGGVVFGLVRIPLINWLANRAVLARLATYWRIAGLYSDREIVRALLAATLRYGVFSAQFYLAMRVVGMQLEPGAAASGIGLVFLVKTVTPAFNLLSDLGVREAAALWVFAPFGYPIPVLITATLLLWFANILTPVLVGLYWVWKLKLTAE